MLNAARKLRYTWGGTPTALFWLLAEAAQMDGARAGDQGRMASSARRKDLTRLAAAGLVERGDGWTWRATAEGRRTWALLAPKLLDSQA